MDGVLDKLHNRAKDERGFTLIELLGVILIIGMLAAIAIPAFLNQKSKASDASAKTLARIAQTTAETVAIDNFGSYANIANAAFLASTEPTIPTTSNTAKAWLSTATGTPTTYTLVATAEPTGDTFTIIVNSGVVTRSCTAVLSSNKGGCPNGTW